MIWSESDAVLVVTLQRRAKNVSVCPGDSFIHEKLSTVSEFGKHWRKKIVGEVSLSIDIFLRFSP